MFLVYLLNTLNIRVAYLVAVAVCVSGVVGCSRSPFSRSYLKPKCSSVQPLAWQLALGSALLFAYVAISACPATMSMLVLWWMPDGFPRMALVRPEGRVVFLWRGAARLLAKNHWILWRLRSELGIDDEDVIVLPK